VRQAGCCRTPEETSLKIAGGQNSSVTRDFEKLTRDDYRALLEGDEPVDGHVREPIALAAGPGNLQGSDLCAFFHAQVNSRVAA
jgi:hypothetical protein